MLVSLAAGIKGLLLVILIRLVLPSDILKTAGLIVSVGVLLVNSSFLLLMLLEGLDNLELLLLDLGTFELSLAVSLNLLLLEACSGLFSSQSLGDLSFTQINNFLALGDLLFLGIDLLFSCKLGLIDFSLGSVFKSLNLGLMSSLFRCLHAWGLFGRLDALALSLGHQDVFVIVHIFNLSPRVVIGALIHSLSIGGGQL